MPGLGKALKDTITATPSAYKEFFSRTPGDVAASARMFGNDPKRAVLQHILRGTALTVGAPVTVPVSIVRGTYRKMKAYAKKNVHTDYNAHQKQPETLDYRTDHARNILLSHGLSQEAALAIAKFYLNGDRWPTMSGHDEMTWVGIMDEIQGDYEKLGLLAD